MPITTGSPRPVPSPTGLVVKKGSNTCSRVSASMPCPVSLTVTQTARPGTSGTCVRANSWSTTLVSSETVSTPPPARMACAALLMMFIMAW